MQGSRLWQRLLKTRAMREQHAVCSVCSLPLVYRFGELTRQNPRVGFVPENVRLVHSGCRELAQRQGSLDATAHFQSVAAE